MIINPISTLPLAPEASSRVSQAAAPTADYNTFIKLLVAQLKNQDPTNTADPTKFVSELASFSAVEQTTKLNSKMDDLFISSLVGQAGSFVGKQVQTKDGVKGIIKSVKIFTDGLIATLKDGKEIILGPGDTISNPDGSKSVELQAEMTNFQQFAEAAKTVGSANAGAQGSGLSLQDMLEKLA